MLGKQWMLLHLLKPSNYQHFHYPIIKETNRINKRNMNKKLMAGRPGSIIHIYDGEGSGEDSKELLHRELASLVNLQHHRLEYITPAEIKQGLWKDVSCLIAFGGGYDLGFEAAVGREGAYHIRDFVTSGGSYLGICAGAYWACDFIHFDKGGPLEVTGQRHLKFFPGLCVGPALPGFQYHSKAGVHAVPVQYKNTINFDAYLEGGGFFQPYRDSTFLCNHGEDQSQTDHNLLPSNLKICHAGFKSAAATIEPLASYSSFEPEATAIVKCMVGGGVAILSGVHVEFSAHLLEADDMFIKNVIPLFLKSENIRRSVFRDILAQLGVKLKKEKP